MVRTSAVGRGRLLNFRLKPSAMARALPSARPGRPLFFQKTDRPRCVVIDFSSPNVAKPIMSGTLVPPFGGFAGAHPAFIGAPRCHGQSSRRLGNAVREIVCRLEIGLNGRRCARSHRRNGTALKLVNAACEQDPEVLETARQELVKLQSGDEENLRLWREMIALSESQFERIYARLGITFDYELGESYYNPRLKAVVERTWPGADWPGRAKAPWRSFSTASRN